MAEQRSWRIGGAEVRLTLPEGASEEVRRAWERAVAASGHRPPGGSGRRSRARSRARSREPLSVQRIVDVAIEQMRERGYDAVTMRSIARELETGPASLYAHVANREELDALVVDRLAAQVHIPDPDPDRWDEQLREVAHRMRQVYLDNPGVARASMGMVPLQPGSLVVMDRLLALLRAGDVPDQYAAWFCDVVALYVAALAVEADIWLQREDRGGMSADHDSHAAEMGSFLAALPAEHFPVLASMAPAMTRGTAEERFSFGLDLLIEGLKQFRR